MDELDDVYLSIQSDFIYFWCKEYGLPEIVMQYLDRKGFRNGKALLCLSSRELDGNLLTPDERYLLTGALQQYRQHQAVVDDIVQEKSTHHQCDMLNRAKQAIRKAKRENLPEQAEFAKRIMMKPDIFEYIRKQRDVEEKQHRANNRKERISLADTIMKKREEMGMRCESAPVTESTYSTIPGCIPQRSVTSTSGLLQNRHRLHTPSSLRIQTPPVEYVTYEELQSSGSKHRGPSQWTNDKLRLPDGLAQSHASLQVDSKHDGTANSVFVDYEVHTRPSERNDTKSMAEKKPRKKHTEKQKQVAIHHLPVVHRVTDTDVIIDLD